MHDREAFTLAWLPPFIPTDVVPAALQSLYRALVPGGWLVMAMLGAPSDPLGQALGALRLARIGTPSWTSAEIENRLSDAGFDAVETSAFNPMTTIVVGCRKALMPQS